MSAASSSPPPVSVVMTVFNGAAHLGEALDSVLAQTMREFELIVVDDLSTDASPAILAGYARLDGRIRLVRNQQNRGPYDSANVGLEQARGRFIARMDADDRCWPDRLERQLRFLDNHPDHLLVGGSYRSIGKQGETRFIKRNALGAAECAWTTAFRMPMVHPGFFFRSRLPDGAPVRYAGGRAIAQDYELASRLARAGRTAVLDALLVDYRMHDGNISTRRLAEQRAAGRAITETNLRLRYPSEVAEGLMPFLDVFYRMRPGTARTLEQSASALEQAVRVDAAESGLSRQWLRRRAAGLLAEAFLGDGSMPQRLAMAAGLAVHGTNHLLPLAARLAEMRRLARPLSAAELRAQPA